MTLTPLNELKGLKSLTLNGNRISEINLNLPILTSLSLNANRLTSISGLRGLKKLEELSIESNLIEDASMQDLGFMLISLTELNLGGNKIGRISRLVGYPWLKKLNLDRNPITAIEANAFRDCSHLE